MSSGVGTVSATGYVRLERLRAPLLSLRIVGDDFSMIDVPEFMSLTTSGDVRLTGPVFGATLTGSGTLTDGIVYFADLIEKRIINLEDTLYAQLLDPEFFNREGLRPDELQRLVRGDFENRFLDSLRIDDMLLEMGSQVWLRSGEANIQMLGSVSVNKTADVYRLDGVLNTPRGTYRLPILGSREIGPVREFTVTGGEVRYFGTTDWDAALDIDAQHVVRSLRRDNVTVFVNIGGTLYDPRLTLSSDVQPAISETEIISYLLFGAPSFEALTSAGAEGRRGQLEWGSFVMAQAGGVVSGELQQYLISDLGVPIDYFQISPTQADISATVGWQPHPRVFLTVSPRLCPSSDEHFGDFGFSMEYRFSRAWLASLSNDPVQPCGLQGGRFSGTAVRYQLGLDVFWEKRY